MQRGRGVRPAILVLAMVAPAIFAVGLLIAEVTGYEQQARSGGRRAAKIKAAERWRDAPVMLFRTPVPAPPHPDFEYQGLAPALGLSRVAGAAELGCAAADLADGQRVGEGRSERCAGRGPEEVGVAARPGTAPVGKARGAERSGMGDGHGRRAERAGRVPQVPVALRGVRTPRRPGIPKGEAKRVGAGTSAVARRHRVGVHPSSVPSAPGGKVEAARRGGQQAAAAEDVQGSGASARRGERGASAGDGSWGTSAGEPDPEPSGEWRSGGNERRAVSPREGSSAHVTPGAWRSAETVAGPPDWWARRRRGFSGMGVQDIPGCDSSVA
ncbi:hypothetical protein Sme01_36360 [Sphaerisporangium melleum]|uniref:Uncharacterized protein n=1 Tax=Sphaerisporangium melleum TaxID=321316 RepID=A0A917VVU3_9ACTN|nr:hypothetical protein GCM10007964_71540 [Sphaerisporangium melleum]GII71160.1 hypothetical protein Sme01_36360 [Sphaerisporangium melleum]